MLLAAQPFLAHNAAIHTVFSLIDVPICFGLTMRDNSHCIGRNAQIFVKALPRITCFLRKHAKPFIAKIANRRGLGAIRLE